MIDALARQHDIYIPAVNACLSAFNEYGPFYPADIRQKATEVHSLATTILKASLAEKVDRKRGTWLPEKASAALTINEQTLASLARATNELEEMIRKRLSEVQVIRQL
jgi:hypothetical protein